MEGSVGGQARDTRPGGAIGGGEDHRLFATWVDAHGRAQEAPSIGASDACEQKVSVVSGQARDTRPGGAISGREDHPLTAAGGVAHGRAQEAPHIGAGDACEVSVGGQTRDTRPSGAIGGGEDHRLIHLIAGGDAHGRAQEAPHIGAVDATEGSVGGQARDTRPGGAISGREDRRLTAT